MAAMEQEEDRLKQQPHSIYLVNFPGIVGSADPEKTTFYVSEILHHLVPEAQIWPHSIFEGNIVTSHHVGDVVQNEVKPPAEQDGRVGYESSETPYSRDIEKHNGIDVLESPSLSMTQADWENESTTSTVSESIPPISIEKEALDLLDTIQRNILTSTHARPSKIILAGNGFGGVVVKQAVIIANTAPKYYRIALSICKLIFFATPHRRCERLGWEQILLDMIKASETKFHSRLSDMLHEFLDSVPRISSHFYRYAAKYPIATFVTPEGAGVYDPMNDRASKRNHIGEDVIFAGNGNILTCDIDKIEQLELLRTHFALPNLPNSYRSARLCQLTDAGATPELYFGTLQTLSPSHWMFYEQRSMYDMDDFITIKEIYDPLLEGIVSEKIREMGCIQVIGPSGCGKSALLKFIVHRISQRSPVVVIENVLTSTSTKPTLYTVYLSFVHQLLSQRPKLFSAVRNLMSELLRRRTWSLGNLRELWAILVEHTQPSEFIFVIYDFEDWPEQIRSWWSNTLRPGLQAHNLTFTFLTSSHSKIQDLSSSEPHQLMLGKKQAKFRNQFLRARLKTLLDRDYGSVHLRPGRITEVRSIIEVRASSFKGSFMAIERYLASLVQTFSLTTLESIERKIEASPKTEQAFYELEIAALQAKYIDVLPWVSSAISWMMGSARPLRIEELATATAITIDDSDVAEIHTRVSLDMERDLRRHLSSIVAIENGQARIASSSAIELFATPSVKKKLALQDDHHLTLLCLHYLELIFQGLEVKAEGHPNLSSEHIDKKDMEIERTGDAPPPNHKVASKWTEYQAQMSWQYQTRGNGNEVLKFLDYACRFWPTHFLRVKEPNQELKDAVIRFLLAPGIGERWFELYLLGHGESLFLNSETTNQRATSPVQTSPEESLGVSKEKESLVLSFPDTTAVNYPLAARMASHVGLEAILLELSALHPQLEKWEKVHIRRGCSERSIAISQSEIAYRLDCAISNDDTVLVKELLDTNETLSSNKTFPLHRAALAGSIETVKMLCNNIDNIVEKDGEGRIPLHWAAAGGNIETISLLLSRSPPKVSRTIDIQDDNSQTPLITASVMGHIAAMKLLIQEGADYGIQDSDGRTVLHYAALTCSPAVEQISFGRLAAIQDNNGCTPLHIVAMSGNVEMTAILVGALKEIGTLAEVINSEDLGDERDENTDREGMTPLQHAAENGYEKLVGEFLRPENDISENNYEIAARLAAARGNVATVALFMERDAGGTIGTQLLLEASQEGQLLIAQYLLNSKHVKPDGEYEGKRPLCQAAARGHIEVARALLRHGASVNTTDNERKTPLHHAAENKRYTLAKTLVGSADLNAPDIERKTPLHYAARSGSEGVVTLLLNGGADSNATSRTMETPLHLSVDYPGVVSILLASGADPNAADELDQTPLHRVAHSSGSKSLESAQYLLNHGAEVEVRDDDGRWAIYYAIEKDDLPMFELLRGDREYFSSSIVARWAVKNVALRVFRKLVDSARAAQTDADGALGRLLHIVASGPGEFTETVTMLLEAGVNPNFREDDSESTALHIAAEHGRIGTIRILVAKNADVSLTDGEGKTPLHLAASNDLAEAVDMLCNAGADINARDHSERTAVYMAAYSARLASLKALLKFNPDLTLASRGFSPLHIGVDNLDVVRLLVSAKADPNIRKSDQWTPLHLATYWEEAEVVKYLLEKGGNPNLTTSEDQTALHFAVKEHSTKMVSAMLDKGAAACINKPDMTGYTPFHLAVQCRHCHEIVQSLLEHGADLKNPSENKSVLELACKSGNVSTVEIILRARSKELPEQIWQHEDVVAAYWAAIEQGSVAIFDALLTQYPNLVDEVRAEEGHTSLDLCLSKMKNSGQGGDMATRLVQAGVNPFIRSQPNRPSAFELAIISKSEFNSDFFNACCAVDDKQIAAAKIGFKELRIAAELDQTDLWKKLIKLQSWKTLKTEKDQDNWTLGHFIHQAAGRLPTDIDSILSTSFLTPQKLVIPEFWESPDEETGSQFEIEGDGVSVSCSLPRGSGYSIACLRADHPFPPRLLPLYDAHGMYFEVTIFEKESQSDTDSNDSEWSTPVIGVGLCGEFSDLSQSCVGWRTWSAGYHGDDGAIFEGKSHAKHYTGHTFGPGDTVGCGIDYASKEYFFTREGEVIARQKSNVIFRKLYPAINHLRGPCKIKVNFGDEDFLWQRPRRGGLRRTPTGS